MVFHCIYVARFAGPMDYRTWQKQMLSPMSSKNPKYSPTSSGATWYFSVFRLGERWTEDPVPGAKSQPPLPPGSEP